jgi:hypothetical protein
MSKIAVFKQETTSQPIIKVGEFESARQNGEKIKSHRVCAYFSDFGADPYVFSGVS